jgi:hypothetical protein
MAAVSDAYCGGESDTAIFLFPGIKPEERVSALRHAFHTITSLFFFLRSHLFTFIFRFAFTTSFTLQKQHNRRYVAAAVQHERYEEEHGWFLVFALEHSPTSHYVAKKLDMGLFLYVLGAAVKINSTPRCSWSLNPQTNPSQRT